MVFFDDFFDEIQLLIFDVVVKIEKLLFYYEKIESSDVINIVLN